MARIRIAYGNYDQAQPLLERALTLANKPNTDEYELAMCLIDAAYLYKKQDKLASAEKMCEQGLELQQKVLYKNHPYIAHTLRILSSIYREQEKFVQAESALDKATDIMRSCHAEDEYTMVLLEVDRAKLLFAQGNLMKAESHYSHSLSIINKQNPEHLYKASVLEDMADLYILQGKYGEAEPMIDEAISMKTKVYGADHHFLVSALFVKAGIERVKGNYGMSEEFIGRALSAVEKTNNITKIIKSQLYAEDIRTNKILTQRLIANAAN